MASIFVRSVLVALLPLFSSPANAQAKPLNDTGVIFCGGAGSGNYATCLGTEPAGQDKNYGRDAAALAGTLIKTGGSAAANGFDFTKFNTSGAAVPTSAMLGPAADEFACTRDNVTGLLWEVKTTSGLRDMNHTYSWFRTDSPDGNNGTASGGTCASAGRCDTEKFTQDVNSLTAALCGYRDWRMPTVKELEGIADLGRASPAIDPVYFPNTPISRFWSGSPNSGSSTSAWYVGFASGNASYSSRDSGYQIRLVRGGQ